MSVINKMLQELDRRSAAPGSEAEQPPQQVRVVPATRGGHEWFWWTVALLMLAAVSWVAWVGYQLRPKPPLATDLAFKAAEQARASPAAIPTPPAVPATQTPPPAPPQAPLAAAPSVAAVPVPKPAPVPEAAAAPKPVPREAETFKLAKAIETPIAERGAEAPPAEAPKVESAGPQAKPLPPLEAPKREMKKTEARKASTKAAAAPAKAVVDKRERGNAPADLAEARFRRAVVLLNQGRVSEAEDQLVGALLADPTHASARQTYVSLLLEQQRLDAAKRVLNETLAANPGQPTFALALARILAEQRDYAAALEVMDRAGSAGKNADFQALRGTVLQRMGRHQEAIDAYQAAVQGGVQPGATWVGLGISLEALGRKAEAAQAYRRSLGGGLSREVREYAEARARALE